YSSPSFTYSESIIPASGASRSSNTTARVPEYTTRPTTSTKLAHWFCASRSGTRNRIVSPTPGAGAAAAAAATRALASARGPCGASARGPGRRGRSRVSAGPPPGPAAGGRRPRSAPSGGATAGGWGRAGDAAGAAAAASRPAQAPVKVGGPALVATLAPRSRNALWAATAVLVLITPIT